MNNKVRLHDETGASTTMINETGQEARLSEGKTIRTHVLIKVAFLLAGILVLAMGAYLLKPAPKDPAATGKLKDRAVPVTVATATSQSVPITIRSIGNVMPFSVVNVLPQVSGQLKKVYFTQGDFVKKGDPLFQIDPSQYQANLAQALGNVAKDRAQVQQAQANMAKDIAAVGQLQANLKRDEAQAKYAQTEVGRYTTLVAQGAVSHEQSDQVTTNLSTAQAAVEADRKAIENAQAVVDADKAAIDTAKGTMQADEGAAQNCRIQLGWTLIKSPLDGRTGSLNVYEGNIVSATSSSNTPMVVIAQVEPIYVNFTVPEQYLKAVRDSLAKKVLRVEAKLEGAKADHVIGDVSFLENTVNTTTGTVVLRAAFPNKDHRLYPGQFVDVVVSMPANGPTVVVPVAALQTTQQGTAVYVMKDKNTVDFRPVKVARTHGDFAALDSGVQSGETVVTDGQLQLTPGAKVKVVTDKHSVPENGKGIVPGE